MNFKYKSRKLPKRGCPKQVEGQKNNITKIS